MFLSGGWEAVARGDGLDTGPDGSVSGCADGKGSQEEEMKQCCALYSVGSLGACPSDAASMQAAVGEVWLDLQRNAPRDSSAHCSGDGAAAAAARSHWADWPKICAACVGVSSFARTRVTLTSNFDLNLEFHWRRVSTKSTLPPIYPRVPLNLIPSGSCGCWLLIPSTDKGVCRVYRRIGAIRAGWLF
jgi:hypothetical protein